MTAPALDLPRRRGACPGLSAPMPTGNGLLVRLLPVGTIALDATFTVTNLGGLGVDAFTPILHLPQCAVLGVGRIVREPAVVEDKIVPRDRMVLSLTFDHRVVDGAPAARFLNEVRQRIEAGDGPG